jgi:hypothetical protein
VVRGTGGQDHNRRHLSIGDPYLTRTFVPSGQEKILPIMDRWDCGREPKDARLIEAAQRSRFRQFTWLARGCLRESARKHGFAGEALEIVAEFAMISLGLRELEAHIARGNMLSQRLAQRHGFHLKANRSARPQWDGDVPHVLVYRRTVGPHATLRHGRPALSVGAPGRAAAGAAVLWWQSIPLA